MYIGCVLFVYMYMYVHFVQVLGAAFEDHVLALDSPSITYISFDFHRHL